MDNKLYTFISTYSMDSIQETLCNACRTKELELMRTDHKTTDYLDILHDLRVLAELAHTLAKKE